MRSFCPTIVAQAIIFRGSLGHLHRRAIRVAFAFYRSTARRGRPVVEIAVDN